MTKEELQAAVDAVPYWYHKINLGSLTTPGWAPLDQSMYRIPDDLSGRRVLDVGAWDGYWSFEALKRGASSVIAIDDFSDTCGGDTNASRAKAWQTLDLCAKALSYSDHRLRRFETDIQEFVTCVDVVFCFGVLYHLRHPLKALENMRKSCFESIHIETAILDNLRSAYNPERWYDGKECAAEFYPNAEFGRNPSNWHVGTLRYWCALVEAAGFKNIESWRLTDNPKSVVECRGFIRATI